MKIAIFFLLKIFNFYNTSFFYIGVFTLWHFYLVYSKDFLDEYQRLTSNGTKDHIDVYTSIENNVKAIAPDKEYTGDFMTKHK